MTAGQLAAGEIITFRGRGDGTGERTDWTVRRHGPAGVEVYRGQQTGHVPSTTPLRRSPANTTWEPTR